MTYLVDHGDLLSFDMELFTKSNKLNKGARVYFFEAMRKWSENDKRKMLKSWGYFMVELIFGVSAFNKCHW